MAGPSTSTQVSAGGRGSAGGIPWESTATPTMGQQSQSSQSFSYTYLLQNTYTTSADLDLTNIIGLSPSDLYKKGGPLEGNTNTNNNNDTQYDCNIYLVLQYMNI